MGYEAIEQQAAKMGLPVYQYMRIASQRALRLTCALNNTYHEPDEVVRLFSELIGRPVGEDFCLFPPFYTDYGQNITIGKGVFINTSCHFQDQGGITIGDGTLIGHNVVLATLNHDMNPANRNETIPAPIVIGKKCVDRRQRHHHPGRHHRGRGGRRGGRGCHARRGGEHGRRRRARAPDQNHCLTEPHEKRPRKAVFFVVCCGQVRVRLGLPLSNGCAKW